MELASGKEGLVFLLYQPSYVKTHTHTYMLHKPVHSCRMLFIVGIYLTARSTVCVHGLERCCDCGVRHQALWKHRLRFLLVSAGNNKVKRHASLCSK